ncbi:MAG TPA: alkaline phosphatase family protein [Gemmatimonadales bacterium]|nr:alkaline phosphatase family protein [Gemmatimonadales bacterium]
MRRLIIALADGLRPDAITPSVMPSLFALGSAYTIALRARTVRPSATVAALTSLATGVAPDTHRLVEPGLDFLPSVGRLRPVARELSRAGVSTEIVTGALDLTALPIAWALATAAGARSVLPAGKQARHTAAAAASVLNREGAPESSLVFVYLPDCDRAGHRDGWMSPAYLEAAAEVDTGIGILSAWTDDAVLVVLADHGGGGVTSQDHDEPHPVNDHIPLIVAGPGVTRRHQLTRAVSILDVPATILWWFGVTVPPEYEGRPLSEAFAATPEPVPA